MDVQGATLGVVGMGRIGQAVAKRARGFDMPVLVLQPHPPRPGAGTRVAMPAMRASMSYWRALTSSPCTTPYSQATHHLIGAAQLAKMKPGAILIHAARAE